MLLLADELLSGYQPKRPTMGVLVNLLPQEVIMTDQDNTYESLAAVLLTMLDNENVNKDFAKAEIIQLGKTLDIVLKFHILKVSA